MLKKKFLEVFAIIAIGLFAGCSDNGNSEGNGTGGGGDNGGGGNPQELRDTLINGIEFVLVRAGTFTMGDDDLYWLADYYAYSYNADFYDRYHAYYKQHRVTLTQDYWISKYPITNAQYGKDFESGKENHPVVYVSWNEAKEWAESKGWRLPTEAEWEFSARGGNNSNGYIYSGSNDIDEVAWYWYNWGETAYSTNAVGQKKPNELGIYDMSGNVWEWCSDLYGEYPTDSVTNPTGPESGDDRVRRGGSWRYSAENCRVAYRNDRYPSDSDSDLGFRVVFARN